MAILERVIRAHEGIAPWFVARAAELAHAVGRISVGGTTRSRGFGTGFLVAPQLVLTCHHTLPDAATAAESTIELDYHRDEDGAFRQVTTVKLDPQRCFFSDTSLDVALIGLTERLPDRPLIQLTTTGDATVGELVTLFHHPHAGPLQISLQQGTLVGVYDQVLHHNANTLPGSAGAPLLDERLRLIGLHHSAVPRQEERARAYTDKDFHGLFVANEAIRATALLEAIAREPHILAMFEVTGDIAQTRKKKSPRSAARPQAAAPSETITPTDDRVRDSVFISYAHADQGKRQWRERLHTFLRPLVGDVDVWDDTRIKAGAAWQSEIEIALKRARVAVLLVGPHFLSSDFIAQHELPPLLDGASKEGVTVLPLVTNYCSYERSILGKYQAFNDAKEPLEDMGRPDQNRLLQKFAEEIDDAFHGRRKK